MVLTGVTVIAAFALLFASRAPIFVPDPEARGSSCAGENRNLDELLALGNTEGVVVRLQPPGSLKKRNFRVENKTDSTNAVSIVRHNNMTERDAESLRGSGLYEEMGLRIANVQICYKAHIANNSYGRMRLVFSVRRHQNLALVEGVRIAEGEHENRAFNTCILEIFEGMAFMPPLGDTKLPEAGAVMVFYPVEVL
jgi:hypothetical protein